MTHSYGNKKDTILINENIIQSKCDMQMKTDTISNDETHSNACSGCSCITTPEL